MMPPTPPPSDGYHQTFSNLSGATQAGDYLTYGLVDTVARKFNSLELKIPRLTKVQSAKPCATLLPAANSSIVSVALLSPLDIFSIACLGYYDVNGKGGSTQLTCSLFSSCHTSSDAINIGGQTQPDGSIDYISESNGFCKD